MSSAPSVLAAGAAAMKTGLIVGIDIGGTKIAALAVDGEGETVGHSVVPTPRDALGAAVIESIRQLVRGIPADGSELTAVGVAAPGHVDAAAGRVQLAVNLGVAELPISSLVTAALGVPCFVDHDARAAAAWLHAMARTDGSGPVSHLAYLSIGTGIAAGIVLDGIPLRGATGLAGEVGHVTADPSGPVCGCGLVGCLEALAAGPAIERLARERMASGRSTSLSTDAPSAEAVFRAAAEGDGLAVEIADEVGRSLARAVRALVLSFGLQRVYVGGGVSRAGDALLGPVERELARERRASALIRRAVPEGVVRMVPPHIDPVARGAIFVARAGLAKREQAKGEKEVTDA